MAAVGRIQMRVEVGWHSIPGQHDARLSRRQRRAESNGVVAGLAAGEGNGLSYGFLSGSSGRDDERFGGKCVEAKGAGGA